MYIKEKRTFKLTMLTPQPKISTNRKKKPKKKIFLYSTFFKPNVHTPSIKHHKMFPDGGCFGPKTWFPLRRDSTKNK
jgi:hypothetical protein